MDFVFALSDVWISSCDFFFPSLPPFSSFRVSTWFSLSGRFSYHLAYISIPFPYYALSQDSVYLIHYEPLWIECVPQNSYINILTPNMIVLGGGALRRWLDGKGEGQNKGGHPALGRMRKCRVREGVRWGHLPTPGQWGGSSSRLPGFSAAGEMTGKEWTARR